MEKKNALYGMTENTVLYNHEYMRWVVIASPLSLLYMNHIKQQNLWYIKMILHLKQPFCKLW